MHEFSIFSTFFRKCAIWVQIWLYQKMQNNFADLSARKVSPYFAYFGSKRLTKMFFSQNPQKPFLFPKCVPDVRCTLKWWFWKKFPSRCGYFVICRNFVRYTNMSTEGGGKIPYFAPPILKQHFQGIILGVIWVLDLDITRKTLKNRNFGNFQNLVEISESVEISTRS